jgi:DNA-binding transcriptional ArsR family regulator
VSERRDVFLDPRNLRGLAHPLRVRLLGLLRELGPATATQLAVRTGQSSGATSYHLRQLAAYGFVVEDRPRAGGRERWWRAAHDATRLDTGLDDPEAAPLRDAFLRAVALRHGQATLDAVDALATLDDDFGAEWHDGFTVSDMALRLSAAEAHELIDSLDALIARYRRDDPATRDPGDGRRRVVVHWHVLPQAPVPNGTRGHGGNAVGGAGA